MNKAKEKAWKEWIKEQKTYTSLFTKKELRKGFDYKVGRFIDIALKERDKEIKEAINKVKKALIKEIKDYYNPKKRTVNLVRQQYKEGHLCGINDFELDLKQKLRLK